MIDELEKNNEVKKKYFKFNKFIKFWKQKFFVFSK